MDKSSQSSLLFHPAAFPFAFTLPFLSFFLIIISAILFISETFCAAFPVFPPASSLKEISNYRHKLFLKTDIPV